MLIIFEFTFGSGINMDIDAGNKLTFTDLDFAGIFQPFVPGVDFFLPPDPDTFKVNWVVDGANANEKLVSFQWPHYLTTADDSTGTMTGFNARWIIESTATLVPLPAAVWLFGSGLAGVAGIAIRRRDKHAKSS